MFFQNYTNASTRRFTQSKYAVIFTHPELYRYDYVLLGGWCHTGFHRLQVKKRQVVMIVRV